MNFFRNHKKGWVRIKRGGGVDNIQNNDENHPKSA